MQELLFIHIFHYDVYVSIVWMVLIGEKIQYMRQSILNIEYEKNLKLKLFQQKYYFMYK